MQAVNLGFWVIVDHKEESKARPTLKPAEDFHAEQDAEVLHAAMKGLGTDEDAIINVLCKRSNPQRMEIAKVFKTLFGKDLVDQLKSETSGNFRELLVALMIPPTQYLARELNRAVKGLGTDEKCLVEIMCSLTNQQIKQVCEAYEELYEKKLEDDLVNDTSGHFKRLLRSLCTAKRSESRQAVIDAAKLDAERLLKAGELQLGTDESTFNEILCNRSYPQLRQIFVEYEVLSGHSIQEAIDLEFSGSLKDALLAIVKCVYNKTDFFAERFYKSMKGLGTDDKSLIRLVVSHCEVDLENIKEAFLVLYEQNLDDFIEDDTSGDYRKSLLALVRSTET